MQLQIEITLNPSFARLFKKNNELLVSNGKRCAILLFSQILHKPWVQRDEFL